MLVHYRNTLKVLFSFTLLIASISLSAQDDPIEVQDNSTLQAHVLPVLVCETAPVITCPPIYVACPGEPYTPDVAGEATAVPGDPDCPEPIITYSDSLITSGPCEGEMYIQRMWTATYPSGVNPLLYADCTQLIFLEDNDGPTIVDCPDNIIVSPNEDCEAVVTWDEPSASDDCGLESFTSNYASGDTFPEGMTTVTYTAVDDCGNTTLCSFVVNVSGSCCFSPPNLECPEHYLGCPGDDTSPANTGMAIATMGSTNCDEPLLVYTDEVEDSGNCAGAMIITRTWTATYENNPDLVSTCTQFITLEDNKAPLITNCPMDITLDPDNNCQAVASWDTPVVTDNCGSATISSDIDSGSTFEEGITVVTYTAVDNCDNVKTCSFTVTVSSCCTTPPTIVCPTDFNGCPETDITPVIGDNCTGTPDAYTGRAVATCNGEANTDDPVGVIYDIRNTSTAPQSADWAPSITDIHPANWTLMQIGQIFGIALGHNSDIYLGASDIYDTQYDTDPYGPGQIFKAKANNDFLAQPFVDLPNTGGALNGIGNLVFDKTNNQLFASNLEDGKIYRISSDGSIIDSYDPWEADNGSAGIVSASEQVWGIGLNVEDGAQKLYFSRIYSSTRDMYSITLSNGSFPTAGSEVSEFSNIPGVGLRISDVAFSNDGNSMVFAERGTKFTTGAHDSKTMKYTKSNGSWAYSTPYYVGSWVTEDFPSIIVEPGENSAGGVDFGATNVGDEVEGCDQLVWASMNYLETEDGDLFYGIQGMDADGNNSSEAPFNPNIETDLIIDFDGEYETFVQKGDLGDVEIFKPGGTLESSSSGIATATSAGNGCGEPIISYSDEVVSSGPCEGETSIERTWTATDSENPELQATCIQVINLGDNDSPQIENCPTSIEVETTTSSATVTFDAPTATDDCGLASLEGNYSSGSDFPVGTTMVVFTATDNCGNVTVCSFSVTVIQVCGMPPVIDCPDSHAACPETSTDPGTTGSATAEPASESCGVPIITYADEIITSGPCTGAIKLKRTWTATDPDDATLVSTCIQIIELIDEEAPEVFDCPEDITVESTTSTAEVSWAEPTATDNCVLEWIMGDYVPGDTFQEGTTLVTYTAVDDCENTTLCTFNITVIVVCGEAPSITCPNGYDGCVQDSTDPETTGFATAEPATDACGDPIITYQDEIITSGPCTGAIKLKRTWTATDPDDSTLSSSCFQIIELVDDVPPVVVNCPVDITVTTTSSSTPVTWVEPTATDNCNLEWIMGDYSPGDVFSEGTTLVTYSAIDDCENTTICTFNITVEQLCGVAPTIECPDNISACPGSSIHPNDTGVAIASPGSSDCEVPILSYNDVVISSGPCNGAKKIKRTWTATDPNNSDLTVECFQIIELKDTKTPVIFNCPADITIEATGDTTQVVWVEPTATDNCELEWIMGDFAPGDGFPVGSTTVTYTAADICGNETLCTFIINVEEVGTLTCPDDITVDCSSSNGAIVTFDLPELESTCDPCIPGSPIAGFVYMGDLNGSSYYCSQQQATAQVAAEVAASYGGHLAVITTQEENQLLTDFLGATCAYIGYSDELEEGNFVWANGEPTGFTDWAPGQPNNYGAGQDCVVMNCGGGWNDEACNVAHEYIMELPCSSYIQTSGLPSGSVFPVGETENTFTVTDQCGETYTCSFTVTVEEGMSLDCPADYTFSCPQGQNGVYAYWSTPELNTCCTDCGDSAPPISGFMYMGNFEGSDYYCSTYSATWQNAKTTAVANGGHLADINSAGENAFLANILTLQRAWIGFNDIDSEGTFSWTSGAPVSYTNWYPGQPNNQEGNQDYVTMLNDGFWNDEFNNLAFEYIMEVPCNGSVTQIEGPASGSYIPIGTTTVSYAGVDGCGNTDTCSFDITITSSECNSYGQDSWYMWIQEFGIGDFWNNTGNDGGYGDYTDLCADVTQGQIYPIAFTPGFASDVYNVYWKMWIDYNQDGDYFDSGEYVAFGNGINTLTGNLPIPTTCLTGQTTLRLSMKFGSYPTGPCEVFDHGEVEDYCLNIASIGSVPQGFVGDNEPVEMTSSSTNALKVKETLPSAEQQTIDKLGFDTEGEEEKINLYPNPTNDFLTIESENKGKKVFYLLDNTGSLVHTYAIDFAKGFSVLDLSNIDNGVYYLRSADGKHHEKVLILR